MTRLLCLGDSITDCGRLFLNPPLGNGYVQKLQDRMQAKGFSWTVKNCGVDGFTVARLLENAEQSYLPFHADFITILIGINDIGLMMNTGRTPRQQASMMNKFLKDYETLLLKLKRPACRFILMEPFIFPSPAEYRTWFPPVRTMSLGISKLADKYNIPYILLHERLNHAAQMQGTDSITTDGIHLTARGHEILTEELLLKL